jgi:hypothetical protein
MADLPTATSTMQVDETTNAVSLLNGLVKFDGKFANQVQNPIEVPEFLHKLYITLKRIDPLFQMGDKNGTFMAMDAIPDNYNGCKAKFNLQVLAKRDHQHLMFAVTFNSTKPFGVLKRAAIALLKRNSLYMNRHALDAAILDVTTTGWILEAHPRFHSPTVQKERMEAEMTAWWEHSTPEIRQQWGTRLDSDPDGDLEIPDFYINARSVRARDGIGHTIQEVAFLVVAPIKDIKMLNDLFEQVFRPHDDAEDDHTHFIPIHLQRDDAKTYYGLVQQQRQYLQDFQNVSIAGVHKNVMQNLDFPLKSPKGNDITTTLEDALTLHPAIHRLDPGSYVIPLGKWNLSTTKVHAEEARKWIDYVIKSMPVTQRCHTNFVDFPSVTRMQAAPPADPSAYSKLLQSRATLNNSTNHRAAPSVSTRGGSPFSQNPQEPEFPPLLRFVASQTPTSSYAQATAGKNTTASTQVSTITAEYLKGFENELRSIREEHRAEMKALHAQLETRPTPTTTERNNLNNQDGQQQTNGDMGTQQVLQEILRRMDNQAATNQEVLKRMDGHATTNQTRFDTNQNRFDTLDEQQTGTSFQILGINSNMEHLRTDNRQLKEANHLLMERMDLLEGATGPPSPIRKFRRGDPTTQDTTTTDNLDQLLADEDMEETSATTEDGLEDKGTEVGSDPTARS